MPTWVGSNLKTKCFKALPCIYEFFSYLHFLLRSFCIRLFLAFCLFFWTIIILSTAFVTIGLSVRLTVFGWTELLECTTESRQRTSKKTQRKLALKGSTRLARTEAWSPFCGTEGSYPLGVSTEETIPGTIPASVKQRFIDFIPTSFFIVWWWSRWCNWRKFDYITFPKCQVRGLHSFKCLQPRAKYRKRAEMIPWILLTKTTVEKYKVRSNT